MVLCRTAVALGAATLTLALAGAPASAVDIGAPGAGAALTGPDLTVDGTGARPGTTVVVTAATGTGPEMDVTSCAARVGDAGAWKCTLTGLDPGRWTFRAAGINHAGGDEVTPLRSVQVGLATAPRPPDTVPLAVTTGSPVTVPLVAAGAALLALGAGLAIRRSRRSRVPQPQ